MRAVQSAEILRQELGLLFSDFRITYRNLDPRQVAQHGSVVNSCYNWLNRWSLILEEDVQMGALDFQSESKRRLQWDRDMNDPLSFPPPVPSSMAPRESTESLFDIQRRCIENCSRYENSYYGTDIVIVSHQDTLEVFEVRILEDWLKLYDSQMLSRFGLFLPVWEPGLFIFNILWLKKTSEFR